MRADRSGGETVYLIGLRKCTEPPRCEPTACPSTVARNCSEFHQKRIDRAHKRHLSAIRTLAQISKMGPTLQINIAEKQVNTAG